MITIRNYQNTDWTSISRIHDSARMLELKLAGLEDAFLPLVLAWLYVAPEKIRRGVGRSLSEYAISMYPGIRYVEALKGNLPALKLYENLGFKLKGIEEGKMPGNESFTVQVYSLERTV